MNISRRRFFAFSSLAAMAAGATLATGARRKQRAFTVSFFPGSESLTKSPSESLSDNPRQSG